MKTLLLSSLLTFCALLTFAQNKMPHSIYSTSEENLLLEKANFPVSDFEVDMTFEESNISGGRFGWTVSSTGDFNGDGIDDVAVGADMYNNSTGYVGLFFGGDDIASDFIFKVGENEDDFFGGHVSFIGDFNNDGYGDFLANANGYNDATGRCYLFFGSATPDLEPDLVFDGTFTTEWFGYRHKGNGDVNNDGFSDIIISSHKYNGKGAAFIYFGSETPDNTIDFTYMGEANNNFFGNSISIDGDVNNDGYDDILITARGYNGNSGKAYLYYGGETLTDIPEVTFERTYDTDYFGNVSAFAGDINNDGYDDFMIGAYGAYSSYGRCYFYFGGETPNNTADLEFYKDTNGETNFASVLSKAGDFNDDGYDDFMITDPLYNDYGGAAYIYYGSDNPDNVEDLLIEGTQEWEMFAFSANCAGDVNGDEISDLIIGATGSRTAKIFYGSETPDTQADVSLEGAGTENWFGYSTSSAGDFNNDGFEDLIVGGYGYNHYRGRSYIYFGGEDPDNIADVTFASEDVEDSNFGWSVSGIGDINNDGFDDVAVGAIFYATGMPGKVYVYYGGANPDSIVDVVITQNVANDWLGYFVSTAGDINNDGIDDFAVGAVGTQNTNGKAYLYLGDDNFSGESSLAFNGGTSGSWFGASLGIVDFNNDGFDDVVVGAPGHSNLKGKFDVYYGSETPDNISDYTVIGYQSESVFGHSVAGIDDFNGDGFDDILAGAPDYDLNGVERVGQSYLYYGGDNPDTDVDMIFDGDLENSGYGRFVASVGDINNDGFGDFGVGAYKESLAYIYYGAENPTNSADETLSENGGYYGWSFTTCDFNGDEGFDLFVSAYGNAPNGKTYLYYTDSPVNIETQPIDEQIAIYPNPSNGVISLTAKNAIEVKVIDQTGRVQYQKVLKNSQEDLNLSELSNGFYILEIKFEDKVELERIVISK